MRKRWRWNVCWAFALCVSAVFASGCEDSKCGSGTVYDPCFPPLEDAGSSPRDASVDARFDGASDASVGDIDAALDASSPLLDAQVDAAPLLDAAVVDALSPTRPLADAGYRFVLVNTSDASLFVQRSGFSGTSAAFGLYDDGRPVVYESTCELCRCGACSSCGVCGRSLAQVLDIEPGGVVVFPWDGMLWEREAQQCGGLPECQRPVGALVGQGSIAVSYSESYRVTTDFGADDEFLNEPIRTKRVDFHYVDGAETRVELP